MAETNEEQVVRGLLPFDINGQARQVPELKWRANREWKATMQAVFARLISVPADTPDGQQAMLDAERELVMAYDATYLSLPEPRPAPPPHPALGDLEDATETEIDAIYNGLVKVAFPLAASPIAVGLMLIRAAVQSAQANSTSGPLPTGTSAGPTISRDHLPSARSTSSTRKHKRA
jgi:hypothetical protein